MTVVIIVNQFYTATKLLSSLHPYAGIFFLLFSISVFFVAAYTAIRLFSVPKVPGLPEHENDNHVNFADTRLEDILRESKNGTSREIHNHIFEEMKK